MVTKPAEKPAKDLARDVLELEAALNRAIRGKPEAVRLAVIAVLGRGHILIEDVPGVGKTTLARALAKGIGASFSRIQFTSDMLPADILGVSVYDAKSTEFKFHEGPVFAHVVLGDEINRTTPRTQSALLEAMSEGSISVEQTTRKLPDPFIVLATQNPKEHHGTYPLPESQMDRFMLRLTLGYPDPEEELSIVQDFGASDAVDVVPEILSADLLRSYQDAVSRVALKDSVGRDLLKLVRATREHPEILLGVSPRGAIALSRAAQARAFLEQRDFVTSEDVRALMLAVFSHRIQLSAGQQQTGREREEAVLLEILEQTPVQ